MPFMLLLTLMGFTASLSQTPSFILVLRSVKPQDKSFAIGIQYMLFRALAWLPGPILYGRVIDKTCIHWETKCGEQTACRYYDLDRFRIRCVLRPPPAALTPAPDHQCSDCFYNDGPPYVTYSSFHVSRRSQSTSQDSLQSVVTVCGQTRSQFMPRNIRANSQEVTVSGSCRPGQQERESEREREELPSLFPTASRDL
uniref:Uncharacterized protein n=1 Tax=Callorhinchus milii TaxID=7868 RepID=A0A4W3GIN2_CALMI